jgi:hypothetical protein
LSSSLLGYDYALIVSNLALMIGSAAAFPLAYATMAFLKLNSS